MEFELKLQLECASQLEACQDAPCLPVTGRLEGRHRRGANLAEPILSEPGGQRQAKLAAGGLLQFPLMEPHPNLVQLRFAHDPG